MTFDERLTLNVESDHGGSSTRAEVKQHKIGSRSQASFTSKHTFSQRGSAMLSTKNCSATMQSACGNTKEVREENQQAKMIERVKRVQRHHQREQTPPVQRCRARCGTLHARTAFSGNRTGSDQTDSPCLVCSTITDQAAPPNPVFSPHTCARPRLAMKPSG